MNNRITHQEIESGNNLDFCNQFFKISKYIKIIEVQCFIENFKNYDYPLPQAQYQVYQIGIPGGHLSFLPEFLNNQIEHLRKLLKLFVREDRSYEAIYHSLNRLLRIATNLKEQNNEVNRLEFKGYLKYFVLLENNQKVNIGYPFVQLSYHAAQDLKEHFSIRMNFFFAIEKMLIEQMEFHLDRTSTKEPMYSWNSAKPEFEIAELLYALKITGRINPNENNGGTFAKFRGDFYKQFGLSDKLYDQKAQQIRSRKRTESFLRVLLDAINKIDSNIQEI